MASVLSGMLAVVVVVLIAPTWPDGPIKAAATWVRQQVGLEPNQPIDVWEAFGLDDIITFDEGADEQALTTEALRLVIATGAPLGEMTTDVTDQMANGLVDLDASVSDLKAVTDSWVELIELRQVEIQRKLSALATLTTELERSGTVELNGVPIEELHTFHRLVSDLNKTFVQVELEAAQCAQRVLESVDNAGLVYEIPLAVLADLDTCPSMDAEAVNADYEEMRSHLFALIEVWGPACFDGSRLSTSRDDSDAARIADLLDSIDCQR